MSGAKDKNTPRQKISSECRPQTIAGRSAGDFSAGQSFWIRLKTVMTANDGKCRMRRTSYLALSIRDVDRFADECRHIRAELWKIPGHSDGRSEQQIGESQTDDDARFSPARQPGGSAQGTPRAEYKQHCCGEGIERPVAARIGREIPARIWRDSVCNCSRDDQSQARRRSSQRIGGTMIIARVGGSTSMLTGLNFSSSAWMMVTSGLLQEIEDVHFFGE